MRNEITEPEHWRSRSRGGSFRNARHFSAPTPGDSPLSAEAVDAAFSEEEPTDAPVEAPESKVASQAADILQSLNHQLALLEVQREKLQHLLTLADQD